MKKIVITSFLLAGISGAVLAQTTDKNNTLPRKEAAPQRKVEKTTIVIDNDNITVNGKKLNNLKELDGLMDLDIFNGKHPFMEGGPKMKFFGDRNMPGQFNFGGETRAFLGVTSEKADKGTRITSVSKESAAAKAGLKEGDIITKLGDIVISNSDDLYEAVGKFKPEEKVTITYWRDGKENTVSATLGKTNVGGNINVDIDRNFNFDMPGLRKMALSDWRKPRMGMQIQDLEEGKGVKVLDVDDDTPAQKAGLQKDDIITRANGKDISSVDDLRAAIKDIKEGDTVAVSYQRNGKTQTTDIKFPRKLKTADL